MKKLFALLFLTLFTVAILPAKAQKFGVRVGYQGAAWYKDGSRLAGTDPHSSMYAGVFKVKKIVPAVHLGAGLEYFQNGYNAANNYRRTLHYISVPAYIEAKLGPVFALGGLGVNFKVAEKITANGTTSSATSDDKSKPMDVPVFIGAGFKILMFTIEARYHWGLVKINDGASNQYFQVGAAVSF
jgi:hypothetical protein